MFKRAFRKHLTLNKLIKMGHVESSLKEAVGLGRHGGCTVVHEHHCTEPPAKSPGQLRTESRAELGIDSTNSFNFAFAGNSRTGKSSLINALRGVDDMDSDAAKVDEIECTSSISKYVHPRNSRLIFWDIPGGGTLNNTAATYFVDKKLYAFDMIIIVGAGGFTELEIATGNAATAFNVPIVFVRSKSDLDIDSRSRRMKMSVKNVKQDVKLEIVRNVREQLPAELRDRNVFVVSSRVYGGAYEGFEPSDYSLDEDELFQYLIATAA